MPEPFTFGSLFAGIGGIDLGLERAGMSCSWQVENDPYCNKVLAKHWPTVPRYGDIKELDLNVLRPVDLVAGGFPCQPVSDAGQRRGGADDRWLWPWFADVVRHLRPRFVLVENVSGLLNAQQGRAAQEVFGDLAEMGFDAEWASIPAAAVGAPHSRSRVFLVAHAPCVQAGLARAGGSQGVRRGGLRAAEGAGREVSPERRDVRHGTGDSGGCQGDVAAWIFRDAPANADWETEPGVDRMAHGIPAQVDRLRALGNAVVPQLAEWVGRQIMLADSEAENYG